MKSNVFYPGCDVSASTHKALGLAEVDGHGTHPLVVLQRVYGLKVS